MCINYTNMYVQIDIYFRGAIIVFNVVKKLALTHIFMSYYVAWLEISSCFSRISFQKFFRSLLPLLKFNAKLLFIYILCNTQSMAAAYNQLYLHIQSNSLVVISCCCTREMRKHMSTGQRFFLCAFYRKVQHKC